MDSPPSEPLRAGTPLDPDSPQPVVAPPATGIFPAPGADRSRTRPKAPPRSPAPTPVADTISTSLQAQSREPARPLPLPWRCGRSTSATNTPQERDPREPKGLF